MSIAESRYKRGMNTRAETLDAIVPRLISRVVQGSAHETNNVGTESPTISRITTPWHAGCASSAESYENRLMAFLEKC